MDRRTFVLLTGATSGALIRPPVRLSHSPTGAGWRSGGPAVGRLRFELDDHRRWSLWYYGDGSPVPVVRGAEIVAWVGEIGRASCRERVEGVVGGVAVK